MKPGKRKAEGRKEAQKAQGVEISTPASEMTALEFMAVSVLNGMLANPGCGASLERLSSQGLDVHQEYAEDAFTFARAMMTQAAKYRKEEEYVG